MGYVVVTRARLDLCRQALGDLDLVFVVLDPRPDVVLGRDRAREGKHVAHLFLHLREEMVRELSGVGLWIDSGELAAEETVDAILAGPGRREAPLARADDLSAWASSGCASMDPQTPIICPDRGLFHGATRGASA